MNYDITFCGNDTCPRRKDCHRYLHYKVYQRDKSKNKKTLISMFKGDGDENCSMFWPENQDLKQ